MLTAGRIGEYAASTLPTDRWLHVALPVVPILTRLFDLVVSDLESFGDISEGRVLSAYRFRCRRGRILAGITE